MFYRTMRIADRSSEVAINGRLTPEPSGGSAPADWRKPRFSGPMAEMKEALQLLAASITVTVGGIRCKERF